MSSLACQLKVHFQKLDLLGEVSLFLVILLIVVHLCKEGLVIEVIDGILEKGIG